jgi:hypothetical protein
MLTIVICIFVKLHLRIILLRFFTALVNAVSEKAAFQLSVVNREPFGGRKPQVLEGFVVRGDNPTLVTLVFFS